MLFEALNGVGAMEPSLDVGEVQKQPELEAWHTDDGLETHDRLFIVPQLAVARFRHRDRIRISRVLIAVEHGIDALKAFRLAKLVDRPFDDLLRLLPVGAVDVANMEGSGVSCPQGAHRGSG